MTASLGARQRVAWALASARRDADQFKAEAVARAAAGKRSEYRQGEAFGFQLAVSSLEGWLESLVVDGNDDQFSGAADDLAAFCKAVEIRRAERRLEEALAEARPR